MPEPKYQVHIRFYHFNGENEVEINFARPTEYLVFSALKLGLEPFGFTVAQSINTNTGETDPRRMKIHWDYPCEAKARIGLIVNLLKSEGFNSFFFIRDVTGGRRQGNDIESILD